MKSVKGKLIISTLIFFVGGFVNIFFTTALHQILSQQSKALKLVPISECIKSIATERQHLLLFLCFQGFIAILAVLFFVQNSRPYQSDLIEVTPDIKTPVPVGQYQHGSAKWLTDKEKNRAFESFILNPNDKFIKQLLNSGYDNLDFLKKEAQNDDQSTSDNSKDVSYKAEKG